MPIVVDTNCLSSVFDKACIDHAEFEPVLIGSLTEKEN